MGEGQVSIRRVGEDEGTQRLDRWLRRTCPQVPQALLQRLLRSGQIRVDGHRAKADTRLAAGQEVRLPPQLAAGSVLPERPRLDEDMVERLRRAVLFEDEWVLALNKPPGLAVQGGSGQKQSIDRLVAGLVPPTAPVPRLVHRLDRDTSGVLLLAKSAAAARSLAEAFQGREARKLYWALAEGVPKRRAGRIDRPLARQGGEGRQRMAPDAAGQAAETLYATAAAGRQASLLVLAPLTGRTHQIRAHLAAIGHPILGDRKYGATKVLAAEEPPLMLHAAELAVPHPDEGTTLRIAAPAPPAFLAACRRLGLDTETVHAALAQLEARGA